MRCNEWERRETSEDLNEVVRKYMIVKLREAWLKTWLSHGSRTQTTDHKLMRQVFNDGDDND